MYSAMFQLTNFELLYKRVMSLNPLTPRQVNEYSCVTRAFQNGVRVADAGDGSFPFPQCRSRGRRRTLQVSTANGGTERGPMPHETESEQGCHRGK